MVVLGKYPMLFIGFAIISVYVAEYEIPRAKYVWISLRKQVFNLSESRGKSGTYIAPKMLR